MDEEFKAAVTEGLRVFHAERLACDRALTKIAGLTLRALVVKGMLTKDEVRDLLDVADETPPHDESQDARWVLTAIAAFALGGEERGPAVFPPKPAG